jgi:hypothetical protein
MAAGQPFRFETAAILTRLTNRRANSLGELRDALEVATTSMIFRHTHTSLLERHFVPGAPQNDFVHWVDRVLRERVLAEKLAAIDPYEFTDLQELRRSLLGVLETHFHEGGEDSRASAGEEFHFLESVTVVSPTQLVAEDLEGFHDALLRAGVRSIYHHFLTARLRIGRATNDFSAWLEGELGETAIARAIEGIDPGVGTLEDSRLEMLRIVGQALRVRKRNKVLQFSLLGASALGALGLGMRATGKKGASRGTPDGGGGKQ